MNKRTHAWTLGSQRRAVGFAGTDPAVEAAARWERATAERRARGAERGFVNFGHGGTVTGDAGEVPSLSDLPSALSAVGAFGGTGEGVAEVGATTASRSSLESGGSLHRRHVCGGEKGASGWVLPSEARGPRSRLSPLATVYLSPSVSQLLRPTNRNSSKRPSATASSTNYPPDGSETEPTIATR